MFTLTRRGDYAMRMMLDLAAQPAGARAQAGPLAGRIGVPRPFLHKITADLVAAGLVGTRPGRGGGLALARPAASITVLEVLSAVEGPPCLNTCLVRPHECPRDRYCPAHRFWGEVQETLVGQLHSMTLERLAAQGQPHRS